MISVSMAYTTPAVVAQAKVVTRRRWKSEYVRRFHKDTPARAWSKSPRNGGERIATIEITRDPYPENIQDADPAQVYITEGFQYLDEDDVLLEATRRWCETDEVFWVVPFRINLVDEGMFDKYTTPEMIAKARADLLKFLP